jgi:hypothetical protein
LRRAIQASNGRIDVDTPLRGLMREIAQPLGLGEMHERHFLFKEDWPNTLRRNLASDGRGDAPLSVARVRAAIDMPTAKGMPDLVQNLLIMVFAEHGQYAFLQHGQEYEASLKDMPDHLLLIKQERAEPAIWKQSLDKAAAIFGLTTNPLRTANNQNELVKSVHDEVRLFRAQVEELQVQLRQQLERLGEPLGGNRLRTAEYAVELLGQLAKLDGAALVASLADSHPPTSEQALGRCLKSAQDVVSLLKNNNWTLLEKIWGGSNPRGQAIRQKVVEALCADELVKALGPVLRQAQLEATELIAPAPVTPVEPEPVPVDPPKKPGIKVLKNRTLTGLGRQQALELLAEIQAELAEGQLIDVTYTISAREDGES